MAINLVQELPSVVAGLLLVGLALVVWSAKPRDAANVYFAIFLALLAAGTLAGVAWLHEARVLNALERAGDFGSREHDASFERLVLLQRLFWIPYLFDPLALLYFAGLYPQRNALHRPLVLAPFAGVAAVLLALDVFAPAIPPTGIAQPGEFVVLLGQDSWRYLVATWAVVAYLVALAVLGAGLAKSTGNVAREQGMLLVSALSVAVFARVGLLLEDIAPFTPIPEHGPGLFSATSALALGSAAAYFAILRRRATPEALPSVHAASKLAIGLIAGIALLVWFPAVVLGTVNPPSGTPLAFVSGVFSHFRYASRWLVFGALTAYSVLRLQLFDLDDRLRRAMADGVAGTLALALVAGAAIAAQASGLLASPATLVLVAALAPFGLYGGYRAARAALPVRAESREDGEAIALRKMEVYRAAVESHLERRESAIELERLRESLGIPRERAEAIERAVRAPRAGGALLPGVVVSERYELLRFLGRGGGGRVFLASDTLLGREVVVKEVEETASPGEVANALSEARAASKASHPNVVTIFDIERWGRDFLIVMEHAPGGSIADRLRERGRLPPDEAIRAFADVLRGLGAVHARGIVHGDVKPGNVLVDAHGRCKIADFGIARADRASSRTIGSAPRGLTVRYAAPEVRAGAATTPASDVYSAALVLLECLGASPDSLAGPLEATVIVNRSLGPEAAALARACLAADPQDRPRDAAIALDRLGTLRAPSALAIE